EGHTELVHTVIFSPDGRYICSSSGDNIVRLWDTVTGQLLMQLKDPAVISLAFSPDGMHILTFSQHCVIAIWAVETGELQSYWSFRDDESSSTVSSNAKYIASGSYDQTVHVWDIETQKQFYVFYQHTDIGRTIAFSPDDMGLCLFEAGAEPLDSIVLSRQLHVFQGHVNPVTSVAFSPDQRQIVSG
ncbi:WD40-repeat-containing domain protein, partial [Mycena capillaripes]